MSSSTSHYPPAADSADRIETIDRGPTTSLTPNDGTENRTNDAHPPGQLMVPTLHKSPRRSSPSDLANDPTYKAYAERARTPGTFISASNTIKRYSPTTDYPRHIPTPGESLGQMYKVEGLLSQHIAKCDAEELDAPPRGATGWLRSLNTGILGRRGPSAPSAEEEGIPLTQTRAADV